MDPASISFAVIGMFLTCCKGYTILSDFYKAPKDAQDAARRIRIESGALASWGAIFELRPGMQRQQQHGEEKLSIYLIRNQQTRRGVFDALCAISEIFLDIKRLDRKYGVVFDYRSKGDRSPRVPREIQDLLDGRVKSESPSPRAAEKADERMKRELGHYESKMSLLERCRWSLRGKTNIQELIDDLRRYNDDLFRLCTWEAQAQINRALACLVVPQSKNFVELHIMADLAEEAAKDKTSPVAEGRKRIAEMARFKARLMTPPKVFNKYQAGWQLLDQRDYRINSTSSPYSLGESLRTQDPVFVEWQSYRGQDDKPDKLAEKQIHRLGDLLTIPNRPHDFRALDCIGLFKDHAKDRYGVVYNLPEHLRSLPHRTRTDNRRIYNPSTLTQLIHKVDGLLDLGHRFNLARKLIQCIVVMHTCGWLHKNIRSNNIFFFAARAGPGETVKVHLKDVGRPIIVGYGLSRPDDFADGTAVRQGPNPSRTPAKEDWQFSRGHMEGDHSDNDDAVNPPIQGSRRHREGHNIGDDAEKLNFDIYKHPDKLANPDRRFRHSYDIYSLGLVLLEIGLWQDLSSFHSSKWKDAYDFRTFVLERLVPDLWGQCGAIYGGVVKECLTMRSDDLEVAEEGQRKLAREIAEKLEKCVA